jgi:hypothetical protein
MLWTARYTEVTHDLLGHFDKPSEAKDAGFATRSPSIGQTVPP